MAIQLHPNDMGGGRVLRTFRMGEEQLMRGRELTGEQVRSMRHANRTSLIEKGFLMVWPKHTGAAADAPVGHVRFIKPLGFGKYDVVEGRKVNEEPLDREAAHQLAGIPLPEPSKAKEKPQATN